MLKFTHPVKILPSIFLLLFAVTALAAQPRIGFVEVFGNRKLTSDKVMKIAGVKPGDPLPKSKGQLEEKIEEHDDIVAARAEVYCCEEGKPILYLGIEERGFLAFRPRTVLEEEVFLPEEVVQVFQEFASALARAVAAGDTEEDLSAGHSVMKNLPCRVLQQRFLGLAQIHEPQLRRVLISSSDAEQRGIAAYVLGYVQNKKSIIADLQLALQDPAENVRANAARSLRAIAEYAKTTAPEEGVRVQPTWFVEMLNSFALKDRIESAKALVFYMQDPIDEALAAHIRNRALDSLLEMSRWKHLPHALPSFMLLGRVAGEDEIAIMKQWIQNRDAGIRAFQNKIKKN